MAKPGELRRLGEDVRRELERFGPQAGMPELVDRWPQAVGEAIARHAWPARIARDGTVHVHTADSVWAFELGHRAREIAERLGVTSLRFAPGPLPEPPVDAPVERVEPTPEDDERAAAIASSIADEKLRESVQKAVRLSLARGRLDRPF
jgi:hypothetical protein